MIVSAIYNRKANNGATEAFGIDITKYQEIRLRQNELATVLQRAGHVTICHNDKEVADVLAALKYNAARVFLCHKIEKVDEPIYYLVISILHDLSAAVVNKVKVKLISNGTEGLTIQCIDLPEHQIILHTGDWVELN